MGNEQSLAIPETHEKSIFDDLLSITGQNYDSVDSPSPLTPAKDDLLMMEEQIYFNNSEYQYPEVESQAAHSISKPLAPRKSKKLPPKQIAPAEESDDQDIDLTQKVSVNKIRDQNNCKVYHKILRKFMKTSGHENYILEFEDMFHARYYFTLVLAVIRHQLHIADFEEMYSGLVKQECLKLSRKIQKKTADIQRREAAKKALSPSSEQFQKLQAMIIRLKNQIEHLGRVIKEIDIFSMSACRAFFKGQVKESLRILYQKDDENMKKEYYFLQALQIVQKRLSKFGQQQKTDRVHNEFHM